MSQRKLLGDWGENQAALYLSKKGYKLLARKWRYKHYELDLICYYSGVVVAVEVKTRRQNYLTNAPLLNSSQVRRLRLALHSFCWQNKHPGQKSRLDLITLTEDKNKVFTLNHYRDI